MKYDPPTHPFPSNPQALSLSLKQAELEKADAEAELAAAQKAIRATAELARASATAAGAPSLSRESVAAAEEQEQRELAAALLASAEGAAGGADAKELLAPEDFPALNSTPAVVDGEWEEWEEALAVSEEEKKSTGSVSEAAKARLDSAKARLDSARSGSASGREAHALLLAAGLDVAIAHQFLARDIGMEQLRHLTDLAFLGEIPEAEKAKLHGAIASLR